LTRCTSSHARRCSTHWNATILVGAQAVYLHTGPVNLPVAEQTTDADLALHPEMLADAPLLADAMTSRNFVPHKDQIGRWIIKKKIGDKEIEVMADLLVPEALGGAGSRGARLGVHGKRVARKAKGLEAALVDKSVMKVEALDGIDPRSFEVSIAGPGALLVAKMHKIGERIGQDGRVKDKDGLDVLRLLRAIPADVMSARLKMLAGDKLAGPVTKEAIDIFERHFRKPEGEGAQMAARALSHVELMDTTPGQGIPGSVHLSVRFSASGATSSDVSIVEPRVRGPSSRPDGAVRFRKKPELPQKESDACRASHHSKTL